MRTLSIFIVFLLSINLFGLQMERLQKTEEKFLELINQKHQAGSKEDITRKNEIKKELDSLIHYDTFSKNTLVGKDSKTGKTYWESITSEQQKEFRSLFKELIQEAWIKELKSFNSDKDKTLKKGEEGNITYKNEKTKGNLSMVYTIVKTKDEISNVDFRFTGNYITDFIIDDLSVTNRYRKSFTKHIQQKGFESLLEKMRTKLKELRDEK